MGSQGGKIGRLKHGQRIAFIAAFATLVLAVIKAFVGYLFDSKVLVADAFHSGADLLAIFASGFGLWLASKKKTKRFPYGLYKAETLVTFIIGALIAWAGVEIFKDGYHKLFYVASIQDFPFLPVGVSVISIIAAYFIAKKEKAAGEAIGSQSLLANANESFLDILTSAVVLAGILLAYAKIPYVEGSVVILISLLIFKLGLENVWNSLLVLMDANLDPRLQSEIEAKVNEIYGVKGGCEVKLRQSGPFKMIECTIETSPTLSLYRAHELANKAEDFITKNYEHVESVFIHVEPSKRKTVSAIIPVKDMNGLDSKVHGHFGRAPYYVILKLNGVNTEIEDFYYNEFLGEKKHIGVKVIKTIIRYKVDLLFTSKIGEISFHMLKDNFVDIYRAEEGLSVRDITERYHNGQIKPLATPTHPVEESQAGSKQ
ncbi:MAG TPA: cation diffusion facilitator family transporter [Candidatus Atribacteria bacterium]|nr:cation diffusion facilitator family transporter [Candidatus Atribacteria bacterium]